MCCPRSPPAGFISVKCILWKREKPNCSLCVAQMTWRAWIFSSFQKQKRIFLNWTTDFLQRSLPGWPLFTVKQHCAGCSVAPSQSLQEIRFRAVIELTRSTSGLLFLLLFFFFRLFLNNNKEGYRKFHIILLTPVLDLLLVASTRFWCTGNIFFKLINLFLAVLCLHCPEGSSLVVESRGCFFLWQCTGFLLQWLLLRNSGSRFTGFSSWGSQA